MVKETPNNTSKAKKSTILGAGLYLLIIIISSLVLVFEPNDLDPKSMILPVFLGLFISALPLGCGLAAGKNRDIVSKLGAVALAVVFTFVGFFVIATVAWLVALSRV